MDNNDVFLGCFVSTSSDSEWSEIEINLAFERGKLFRTYVWGEHGINSSLIKLKNEAYGKDLKIILFQFYVNPLPHQLEGLNKIENYRKKEKSIGIPIVITTENFFNKVEGERFAFLKQSILQKLDSLEELIKSKKLDTKIGLLKSDLDRII